ncbi:MAG TPA: o-succinylbenzoate synthase [Acidimicrobiales bacterium]|nr:o-succinylbenzoate synthase [Acidimicrobiales bacterium]
MAPVADKARAEAERRPGTGTAVGAKLEEGRLHLVGLELVRVLLPLRKAWVSEAGSFSQRDSLLVRAIVRLISPAGGVDESEGWGECAALPEPTYSAEYTAGAVEVSERYILPALLGADVARAEDVAPALSSLKGHRMAKAAFEAALLDAGLRCAGVRMADFLAGLSDTGRKPRESVMAGVAVGLPRSLPELLDEVAERVGEGYRRVKLKITPGWDEEPVAAVRRQWPELMLFADANGSYAALPFPEAVARLGRLDGYALACLEQPLGDDDLTGHARLAPQLATPLCLDEPLTSLASVATALDIGACSVVNLKAGRLGGLLEAVRAHDLCAKRKVPVWCGGMVETGVGRAANLALAALPNFSLPGDLSASGRFFEKDVTAPLGVSSDGTILLPAVPGSGAVVDGEGLEAFSAWRRWWPARSR